MYRRKADTSASAIGGNPASEERTVKGCRKRSGSAAERARTIGEVSMLVRLATSHARRGRPSGRGSQRPLCRIWANTRREASPKARARRGQESPVASAALSSVLRDHPAMRKRLTQDRGRRSETNFGREVDLARRSRYLARAMAQNTQSATASRNTVPGTANEKPVAPS